MGINIARALNDSGEERIRELAGVLSDQLVATEPRWPVAFTFEEDDYVEIEMELAG